MITINELKQLKLKNEMKQSWFKHGLIATFLIIGSIISALIGYLIKDLGLFVMGIVMVLITLFTMLCGNNSFLFRFASLKIGKWIMKWLIKGIK